MKTWQKLLKLSMKTRRSRKTTATKEAAAPEATAEKVEEATAE